jgi:hypothetical protein
MARADDSESHLPPTSWSDATHRLVDRAPPMAIHAVRGALAGVDCL